MLRDDGRQLLAEFPASIDRENIQLAWFQQQLAEHKLDNLRLSNEAIGQCITEYNKGATASSVLIGETVDAEFSIKIADDLMHVSLSYTSPQGGEPVTKQQLLDTLAEKGVSFGIQEEAIDKALQTDEIHDTIIAQGTPPVNGKDGYFEKMLDDIRDRRPLIDDSGQAHYNDIAQFVTVQVDEPLIRIIRPTTGTDGKNIKGEITPATAGEPVMFNNKLTGTKISPENSDILLSEIYGQPVFVEDGAIVEPTITVENVDQTTGNIEFDGSVMVNGNVTTGMKIDAEGDVIISGMVEEATSINAGGDIIVTQGIIGRGSISEDNGKPGKGIAKLKSEGKISAKFIENSIVVAGRDIEVGELIAHSDVTAKHSIKVGGKNSKHGHIMGGITRADDLIQVEILGSQAAVNTKILAGVNPACDKALKEIQSKLETKVGEHSGLQIILAKTIKQQSKKNHQMLEKISSTLKQLSSDINELRSQEKSPQEEVEQLKQAKVKVNRKAFNCVEITIFNVQQKLLEEKTGGTFSMQDGELVFNFQ